MDSNSDNDNDNGNGDSGDNHDINGCSVGCGGTLLRSCLLTSAIIVAITVVDVGHYRGCRCP